MAKTCQTRLQTSFQLLCLLLFLVRLDTKNSCDLLISVHLHHCSWITVGWLQSIERISTQPSYCRLSRLIEHAHIWSDCRYSYNCDGAKFIDINKYYGQYGRRRTPYRSASNFYDNGRQHRDVRHLDTRRIWQRCRARGVC